MAWIPELDFGAFSSFDTYKMEHTKAFFLNEVCTPEDETVNIKTCMDNDEFRLISRTCTVIGCTVMRNKNVQENILGKCVADLNHSLLSV